MLISQICQDRSAEAHRSLSTLYPNDNSDYCVVGYVSISIGNMRGPVEHITNKRWNKKHVCFWTHLFFVVNLYEIVLYILNKWKKTSQYLILSYCLFSDRFGYMIYVLSAAIVHLLSWSSLRVNRSQGWHLIVSRFLPGQSMKRAMADVHKG